MDELRNLLAEMQNLLIKVSKEELTKAQVISARRILKRKIEKTYGHLLNTLPAAPKFKLLYHFRIVTQQYNNMLNQMSRGGFLRKNSLLSTRDMRELAGMIDFVFTVPYVNRARHHLLDYFDVEIDNAKAQQEAQQLFDKVQESDSPFVQVSTQDTKCYICYHWVGVIGTVGRDVEGYPRLDGMFPIHRRCIHRLIPIPVPSTYSPAPTWLIGATRKEYYQKMKEVPGGKEMMREFFKPSSNSKRGRVKKVLNSLLT